MNHNNQRKTKWKKQKLLPDIVDSNYMYINTSIHKYTHITRYDRTPISISSLLLLHCEQRLRVLLHNGINFEIQSNRYAYAWLVLYGMQSHETRSRRKWKTSSILDRTHFELQVQGLWIQITLKISFMKIIHVTMSIPVVVTIVVVIDSVVSKRWLRGLQPLSCQNK